MSEMRHQHNLGHALQVDSLTARQVRTTGASSCWTCSRMMTPRLATATRPLATARSDFIEVNWEGPMNVCQSLPKACIKLSSGADIWRLGCSLLALPAAAARSRASCRLLLRAAVQRH